MKNFINNLNIRNKIFFTFLLMTAVMILSIANILPQIKNTLINNTKQEMVSNTKLASIMTQSLFDNSIKNYLRGISETHLNTVQYFYLLYQQGKISKKEAIDQCEKLLLSHKIGKSGYITAVDISKGSKEITLAIHPKAKGKDISKFQFVQDLYQKKHGYMEFLWKNPKEQDKRLKVMYMSQFNAWQWIINAAPYKNELHSLMDIQDFRQSLENAQLSKEKNKIFVVFDLKGKMIYHPTFSGKSAINFQDKKTGRYFAKDIIREIQNNGIDKKYNNWTEFSFDSYGIENKLMYYIYLPKYKWVVSTIINKNSILKSYNELLFNLIFIVSIMFILIIIIAIFFAQYINKRVNRLVKSAQKLSKNDYDFDLKKYANDEIGTLEVAFDDAKNKIQKLNNKHEKLNSNLVQKVQKELQKNRKKDKLLYEQSKMASMGEMIGNIAHQWRQPLSVISTGATGLKFQNEYGMLTDELISETCDTINDNAQYLSKTIDDFKNFIKGTREKENFSLHKAINSFLQLVDGSIKSHNIHIVSSIDTTLHIDGYKNELIQCLINIFNNAKDALENMDDENKFVFISTTSDDTNVTISIQDNAGGIPEDILSKIFEPYFTTKHQSQGTGLGLHMTYSLITDGMKGTIDAQNINYEHEGEKYTGAQFTITLPLS
ncbi:MAG: cache domain-containing protein [Campylobacterota bacterium]|nr:cache domain-containing protein [Campylobacterota bacterium]